MIYNVLALLTLGKLNLNLERMLDFKMSSDFVVEVRIKLYNDNLFGIHSTK